MTTQDEAQDSLSVLESEPDVQELEKDSPIEHIGSEIEDSSFSPSHYEIVSIPADYTLDGLATKWKKGQLKIPGFQRKFVWTQRQASRLIESFLLGLPVPALFLYADPDTGDQQVIDGQQRLMSVVQYFEGSFQNASMANAKQFRLIGLGDDSPYKGCDVASLGTRFPAKLSKLGDAVMRAFVVRQLDPNDSTSIYHIFERLNTGGTRLLGQEIRNCVYHGRLNELINSLNMDSNWRKIIGQPTADSRMRDIEMILRFVALYFFSAEYKKPMKDFLSSTMRKKRNLSEEDSQSLGTTFRDTCAKIVATLGERPFHGTRGMNPAIFDAMFTTIAAHPGELPVDFKDRCDALKNSPEFEARASYRTTDADAVAKRLELARTALLNAA